MLIIVLIFSLCCIMSIDLIEEVFVMMEERVDFYWNYEFFYMFYIGYVVVFIYDFYEGFVSGCVESGDDDFLF